MACRGSGVRVPSGPPNEQERRREAALFLVYVRKGSRNPMQGGPRPRGARRPPGEPTALAPVTPPEDGCRRDVARWLMSALDRVGALSGAAFVVLGNIGNTLHSSVVVDGPT